MTAAATFSPTPSVKHYRPLYRCLGYVENARGFRRYVVGFGDPERIVIRRVVEMTGLDFLLAVYADSSHWRNLYPRGRGKIDAQGAASWFVKECNKIGPYAPSE